MTDWNDLDHIVELPKPGAFHVFALIRKESKYEDQNPPRQFEVRFGADGYWHGNGNRYLASHLHFFWYDSTQSRFEPIRAQD